MLDNLATAGGPTPASMMRTNRPLRAARDAVDGHKVWDLNPDHIEDMRVADRLDPADIADLRESIEMTGQTVPILVRRHPKLDDRYLLVYGRRRLEAILASDKVETVRALIANLDDDSAVDAQITENMARRDLSYIEKALFAHELVSNGYGTQVKVAEVLTVTKSSVSMALRIVDTLSPALIRAIGPAHSTGRPKWEALSKAFDETDPNRAEAVEIAASRRAQGEAAVIRTPDASPLPNPSQMAFDSVYSRYAAPAKAPKLPKAKSVALDGKRMGKVARTKTALRIEIKQGDFANWLEANSETLLQDLHDRWKSGGRQTEQ